MQTQKEKVLNALQQGGWVSGYYLNRGLGITQANARLKELKEDGYHVQTSKQTDKYGFKYHRLINDPVRASLEAQGLNTNLCPKCKSCPTYNINGVIMHKTVNGYAEHEPICKQLKS